MSLYPKREVSPLKPLYTDPTRRFACECGARMTEGGEALEHAFGAPGVRPPHEVVEEEFRNGHWRFVTRDIMALVVERLRLRGESVPDYIRRVEMENERLQAQMEQLERDKVNG